MNDLISRVAATTIPILPIEHRKYQTMNIDDAYDLGWLDCQNCIEKLSKVKRTERGWAGHLIVANSCRFRRNTLLEYEDRKWIISTVGAYYPKGTRRPDMIGAERWYETMVFMGEENSGYIDIDVTEQIETENDWGIWGETWDEVLEKYPTPDNAANDMHEQIVAEMIEKIQRE